MSPMPPDFGNLPIATDSDQDATEVLRAAVAESGELQVTLRRAFDDPEVWGLVLADIARHAARIFEAETDIDEQSALERIRAIFEAELSRPTDFGTTSPIS